MSITRKCEKCGAMLDGEECIELTVRSLKTDEGENQDPAAQAYGDFCDPCLGNGSALAELLKRVEWTLNVGGVSSEAPR